jgi:TRAP-type mannitol/chloroaromatic compound transport system permease large subunit
MHLPDRLDQLLVRRLSIRASAPRIFEILSAPSAKLTLNQIFAGMMPYMLIVILCMVIMYLWPGMTLWLPTYLYGRAAG